MFQPPFPSGQLVTLAPADPAAGAGINVSVTTDKRWHILSVQFRLVTDANVINRVVLVTANDSSNSFQTCVGPNVQVANLTVDYHFSVGATAHEIAPTGAIAGKRFAALPEHMWLRGTAGTPDLVNITIGNQQVGDQISAVIIRYMEYLQAPQV